MLNWIHKSDLRTNIFIALMYSFTGVVIAVMAIGTYEILKWVKG